MPSAGCQKFFLQLFKMLANLWYSDNLVTQIDQQAGTATWLAQQHQLPGCRLLHAAKPGTI